MRLFIWFYLLCIDYFFLIWKRKNFKKGGERYKKKYPNDLRKIRNEILELPPVVLVSKSPNLFSEKVQIQKCDI